MTSEKIFDFGAILAILMFLLGAVQLILALIFTIRRASSKTGWRGWLYYWIGVGIYFAVLIGIVSLRNYEQEQLQQQAFESMNYRNDASLSYHDATYEEKVENIQIYESVAFAWFFSANLLAIYFFFAGKVSDRIAQKNKFNNH